MDGKGRWEEVETIFNAEISEKDSEKFVSALKDSVSYEVQKASNEVSNILDRISSDLYETRYLNNHGRSIKQQMETKFSSIYLLTKKKNGSIKNALINIRGYRAIKSNQLFDIGYYLKNNPDVRLSGDDPIMHYIYYGYKEGRNPSIKFDGKYYLEKYDDVKDINPLVHYSLYGIKEGRKTIAESQK